MPPVRGLFGSAVVLSGVAANQLRARSNNSDGDGTSKNRRMVASLAGCVPAVGGLAPAVAPAAAANRLDSCVVPVAAAPKAARFAGVRVPGRAPPAPVAGTGGVALPRGVPTGGAAGDRRISDAVAGWNVSAGAMTCRSWRGDPVACGLTGARAGWRSGREAKGPDAGLVCGLAGVSVTGPAGGGLLVGRWATVNELRPVGFARLDMKGVVVLPVCSDRVLAIGVSRDRRTRRAPGAGRPPTLFRTAATAGADNDCPIRRAVLRRTTPDVVTPLVCSE